MTVVPANYQHRSSHVYKRRANDAPIHSTDRKPYHGTFQTPQHGIQRSSHCSFEQHLLTSAPTLTDTAFSSPMSPPPLLSLVSPCLSLPLVSPPPLLTLVSPSPSHSPRLSWSSRPLAYICVPSRLHQQAGEIERRRLGSDLNTADVSSARRPPLAQHRRPLPWHGAGRAAAAPLAPRADGLLAARPSVCLSECLSVRLSRLSV